MNTPRRPSNSGNAGTVLALIALLAMGGGLLGLTAMVMPAAFGLLAVIFGFVCFGALHFLLWGWWMPNSSDSAEDESSDSENAKR